MLNKKSIASFQATFLIVALASGITSPIFVLATNNDDENTDADVSVTKIVCDSESDLPNWGLGGPDITASTASDFLAENENCHLESGWLFQWAPENPASIDPGGSFIGEVGNPWTTFGPTDISGVAMTTIDTLTVGAFAWVREVLQSGYIPFTFDQDNQTNEDDVSAEMYCATDVMNYDNLDSVDYPEAGGTYYCIAFNVAVPTPTPTPTPEPTPTPTPTPEYSPTPTPEPTPTPTPTPTPDNGGTGGSGDNPPVSTASTGGGSGGGGGILGSFGSIGIGGGPIVPSTPPAGQVLGETTSCGIYLNEYIKYGGKNNPEEVKKLQAFLNRHEGTNIPITGFYGPMTHKAVHDLQAKYWEEILKPWVKYGLATEHTSTGYVYKTTKRWINNANCSTLNLPQPELP